MRMLVACRPYRGNSPRTACTGACAIHNVHAIDEMLAITNSMEPKNNPTGVDHLTLRAQAHVQYTMRMQIAIADVMLAITTSAEPKTSRYKY